jgi:hypothetical protein
MSEVVKFPERYKELESELLPSKGTQGERVSGSGESSPIPVRLETLHLRSGGISVPLMEHEQKMREIRHEMKIIWTSERRMDELARIILTTQYISKRSEWIRSEYPEADKLVVTIITTTNKIKMVLGHKSEDIVLGKCPTVGDDGKPCGASLKINPQQLERSLEVKCRVCDTIWDSTKWRLLGKMIDA